MPPDFCEDTPAPREVARRLRAQLRAFLGGDVGDRVGNGWIVSVKPAAGDDNQRLAAAQRPEQQARICNQTPAHHSDTWRQVDAAVQGCRRSAVSAWRSGYSAVSAWGLRHATVTMHVSLRSALIVRSARRAAVSLPQLLPR